MKLERTLLQWSRGERTRGVIPITRNTVKCQTTVPFTEFSLQSNPSAFPLLSEEAHRGSRGSRDSLLLMAAQLVDSRGRRADPKLCDVDQSTILRPLHRPIFQ